MLSLILGFVTGLAGPISAVVNKLADLKMKQAETASNTEKMKIDQQIAEAEGRKSVLIAEAGQRVAGTINASIRAAMALTTVAVLWKLIVWDKIFGSLYGCAGDAAKELGSVREYCQTFLTDPMDTNQWMFIAAVTAFYFAYDIFARSRK